jgi:release factor glutamine methyltransferase
MAEPILLLEVLRRTEEWLRKHGVDSPRLDAQLLLGHVLGLPKIQLYAAFDRPMTAPELDALRALVKRRGDREPLAWILGKWGFHKIELKVGPGVLVPRPDTETLVDAALEWIGAPTAPLFVADVGSGSGAVGLAIASACPEVRVYATDIGEAPLAMTKRNVAALGLSARVAVLPGPFLDPIPAARPIDWVVSNPPYIPTATVDALQPEVARWEPRLALDGGRDGLDPYHTLIPAARARARAGCLVEVGKGQADEVAHLFKKAGYTDVRTWKDLNRVDRVVGGRIP